MISRVWIGVLIGTACATDTPSEPIHASPDAPRTRIGVVGTMWLTRSGKLDVQPALIVHDALTARGHLDVARDAESSTTAESNGCLDDLECVRRIGVDLQLDKAIVLKLGELTDTVLLRAEVVDVPRGAHEQTLQEIVVKADALRLQGALQNIALDIERSILPVLSGKEETTWYESLWFWVPVGSAAAAGAALSLFFALRGHDPEPDILIRPP